MGLVVLSPCACPPVRGTGAATLRAPLTWWGLVFKGFRPTSARCRWSRAPWLLLAGEFVWLARPLTSRLFRVARLRLPTPAAVTVFAFQEPRGQRVPLDHIRTLLIDLSAESVESFLPSRNRIWRRLASTSRQLTCWLSQDSSWGSCRRHYCRLISICVSRFASLRRYSLWTHLDLHVEAVMPCWHFRRRLALPTHLELRLEACCRSSFVDSSRRVSYPLPLCVFCHSLHAALLGCLLTSTLFSSLLDLVGLWFAFWNCCT